MQSSYQNLISQLDKFIRKYYLNQLIRGLLYSVGFILLLFTVFSVLEHYYYFGKSTRKIMFYGFLLSSVGALAYWVLGPLLHYFRLGKVISHEQAAAIVGDHFVSIKDKLLNILQLKAQADRSENAALLLAGIEQKTDDIKLVPIPKAINLGQNRKYLRYALPPLLLLLLILFAAPSMITDSASRLIHNDKEFDREAPFTFAIDPAVRLQAIQYQDYRLEVSVDGEALPAEAFIDIGGYEYRLQQDAPDRYHYLFKNVQKPVDFRLTANGFYSKPYRLEVLRKPNLAGFEVVLAYPPYTGRKVEKMSNVGDFVVPAGTQLTWKLRTENADSLSIRIGENAPELLQQDGQTYVHKYRAMRDAYYKLYISGVDIDGQDSVGYTLNVIPDLHPTIQAQEFVDSTQLSMRYFAGDATDDYGLRSLSFHYRITHESGEAEAWQRVGIPKTGGKQIQFEYTFDTKSIGLQPGDELVYYFEVYDNDGVHGSKPARTQQMTFRKLTKEQYEEKAAENSKALKDQLEKAQDQSKDIQERLKKLREQILQKKDMDWQAREEMQKLLEMQKELEKQVQESLQHFQENREIDQEMERTPEEKTQSEEEKLEEMLEEAISDETKELMEKIEELLQELNKEQALEMMKDMEISEEQQEKNLERLEELYKELEMEKAMQDQIETLQELAEKQDELAEKTEEADNAADQEAANEQLQKEQEAIREEFEEVKEKMEEIEKMNEELENPKQMDDSAEDMENIDQDMENSMEQLEQQQNKKASNSQKSAAEQMRQKAGQMQQQMQAGEMQQMEEDMQTLRQLLENLVGLSFDQEELMEQVKPTNVYTPRYTGLVEHQFKLKNDFRLIEDSLRSLAKRQMEIESVVLEKVTGINKNMQKSIDQLEDRKKTTAATYQQFTMKNINDLALMLSESMEQMQQQMSSMMQGQQMCNNPGNSGQPKPGQSKPGAKGKSGPQDKMSKGQGKLGDQMQKAMQKGKGGVSSKELAELAAQQAALRKALEEARREKMMQGKDAKGLQDIIDQMNQNETDLVNKRLNNGTIKRNKDIVTRLLQHEKAERERGFDEQRESETALEIEPVRPPALEEYLKKRNAQIQEYRQVSPSLKPYYQFLVEEYYKNLKGGTSQ